MRRAPFLAAALLACIIGDAGAAAAQSRAGGISQAQAVRIARGYGMTRITELEREDGGWEIEGRDHRGRPLTVAINARGRVTSVDRGDADDDRDDDD